MKELAATVAEIIRRYIPPGKGDTLVVAVSGGIDSMVLLETIHRMSDVLGLTTLVAHLHHGLRSEADEDARFVVDQAKARGLEVRMERADVATEAGRTGESIEMAGHRLRHEFLARIAEESGGLTVALGHHADDQAELVLMRLLRGSGGDGIGAMQERDPSPANRRITLLRPLLGFKKAELVAFGISEGLRWREDASNRDPTFLRNRIRHELLPLLEHEYQPGIKDSLARAGSIVGAEADYASAQASQWLANKNRSDFEQLHVAIQRAVVRRQLWELGHAGEFANIEHLRSCCDRITVPGGAILQRTPSGFIVPWRPLPPHELSERMVELDSMEGELLWERVRIQWDVKPWDGGVSWAAPSENEAWFDAARLGTTICLRHWRTGDRFQSLGLPRPALLKNLLIKRKVLAADRRSLVVGVTSSGQIFWVEGLPPGEAFKVTRQTVQSLRWRFIREKSVGKVACT